MHIDTFLTKYQKLISDVSNKSSDKEIAFIRIDNSSCIQTIKKQANEWLHSWAKILIDMADKELKTVKEEMADFTERLSDNPSDLTHLKSLLHVITEIKD